MQGGLIERTRSTLATPRAGLTPPARMLASARFRSVNAALPVRGITTA